MCSIFMRLSISRGLFCSLRVGLALFLQLRSCGCSLGSPTCRFAMRSRSSSATPFRSGTLSRCGFKPGPAAVAFLRAGSLHVLLCFCCSRSLCSRGSHLYKRRNAALRRSTPSRFSWKAKANRTSDFSRVHRPSFLSHNDVAVLRQAACRFARRLHQRFPVATDGGASDELCGFRGTDTLVGATVGQQFQDGSLKFFCYAIRRMPCALQAAILRDVPVLRPAFFP
jgi:hypothetical protein